MKRNIVKNYLKKGNNQEFDINELGVDEKQLAEWKKQYGDVFGLRAGDKMCIVRRPDRPVIGIARTIASGDVIKFNESVLSQCWLIGDQEIQTEDKYFLSVMGQLSNLVEEVETSLKKL